MWNVSPIRILGMLLLPVTQQLTKFQPTLAMPRNQCHCLLKKEILKYRYYFHEKKIWTEKKNSEIIAESFYYVKYGLSNIMSKVPSKILITENIKTGVSRKIGIWIHILSWRQQKKSAYVFITFDILIDNLHISDKAERFCLFDFG